MEAYARAERGTRASSAGGAYEGPAGGASPVETSRLEGVPPGRARGPGVPEGRPTCQGAGRSATRGATGGAGATGLCGPETGGGRLGGPDEWRSDVLQARGRSLGRGRAGQDRGQQLTNDVAQAAPRGVGRIWWLRGMRKVSLEQDLDDILWRQACGDGGWRLTEAARVRALLEKGD